MRCEANNLVVVGISEMAVSDRAEQVLVTYALGSCVGVTLFDPVLRIGGMIHCMLPSSIRDKQKSIESPFMFVDTGLLRMIQIFLDRGSDVRKLICKIAGAGTPLHDNVRFKVGEKNYQVLKKILERNRITVQGECVGGVTPKTLFLLMSTGKTIIRIAEQEEVEL